MRKKNLVWIAVLSSLAMVPSLAFADDATASISTVSIAGNSSTGKSPGFTLATSTLSATGDSSLSIGKDQGRGTFDWSSHGSIAGLEGGFKFSAGQAMDRGEFTLGLRAGDAYSSSANRIYAGSFVNNNEKIRGNEIGLEHEGFRNVGRLTVSDDIRVGRLNGASTFDRPIQLNNIVAHESEFGFAAQYRVGQNLALIASSVTDNMSGHGMGPLAQNVNMNSHNNKVSLGIGFQTGGR